MKMSHIQEFEGTKCYLFMKFRLISKWNTAFYSIMKDFLWSNWLFDSFFLALGQCLESIAVENASCDM